jgi:hypothetical protein
LYHKYYFERPKQLSQQAWACLLFASYLYNHHLTHSTTLHVPTKNIKNKLTATITSPTAPNTCFCPEWEILHQAAILLHRQNTTISIPNPARREELDAILEEIISNTVQKNLRMASEQIYQIQSPYLTIQHKRITSHYSLMIRHALTAADATEYLQQKHLWTNKHFLDIQWHAHERALFILNGRIHKTITQLIHHWLPVNASHSKASINTTRLCPFCTSCDETQQHWLECQHQDLTNAWQRASDNITRKIRAYNKNIDTKLIRLLGLAVTAWRTTRKPKRPDFLPPTMYSLFDHQAAIGWNQIILGRFSKHWQFSTTHNNLSITAYIIRTVWIQVYVV